MNEKHDDRLVEPARLALVVTALDHPLRLRVIALLRGGRRYVSALARDLGISRPLLYMHLDRLEKAGLVTSSLELGTDGKAVKWYELLPFELRVTAAVVAEALATLPPTEKET
jgi:DNA-binding transcriptional ArsR family regulator